MHCFLKGIAGILIGNQSTSERVAKGIMAESILDCKTDGSNGYVSMA